MSAFELSLSLLLAVVIEPSTGRWVKLLNIPNRECEEALIVAECYSFDGNVTFEFSTPTDHSKTMTTGSLYSVSSMNGAYRRPPSFTSTLSLVSAATVS